MRGKGLRMLGVVLLACAVLTGLGFLLKAPCMGDYEANRNRYLCVNDIQVLYVKRGMDDGAFPYIHGDLVDGELRDGAIEYPVLTGLFAWLPTQLASDDSEYLIATATLLAPFSLLTAWLLWRMVGRRALLYALAPPLIWYSFHNWDLLVVAATVLACYAWWKGRAATAGVLLVIGGCLKLWPLFFLAPLVLSRLADRDRADAVRVTLTAVGSFVLINGWFVLVNVEGWWASYQFQALRDADITSNSIWYWGLRSVDNGTLNVVVPILLGLSFTAALVYGWVQAQRQEEAYPNLAVCAAILCAFLLFNKAHSPQFALWLLPFFVLLRVRWGWWATYLAFDAALYVGLFRWYYERALGEDFGLAKLAMLVGVWGRAVILVALFVVFLRSRPALELDRPAPPADTDDTDATDPIVPASPEQPPQVPRRAVNPAQPARELAEVSPTAVAPDSANTSR
ncbi:MAG: glycosyltransferase family 87 protein [Geodermatophilaceae bacterium]